MAKLKPPPGYDTWLDYAVEKMPVGELCLEAMFNDVRPTAKRKPMPPSWLPTPSCDAMRAAARAELDDLRKRLYEATHLGSLD